jgi:hypothetical protein
MKYMLLIYNNQATYESWSEAEREALFGEVDALMTELRESGELVGGEALADQSNSRTVRVRDGVPAVTDGPYAEAKEQMAGFLMVDCENIWCRRSSARSCAATATSATVRTRWPRRCSTPACSGRGTASQATPRAGWSPSPPGG